jgi:hypothetical protein
MARYTGAWQTGIQLQAYEGRIRINNYRMNNDTYCLLNILFIFSMLIYMMNSVTNSITQHYTLAVYCIVLFIYLFIYLVIH